MDEMRKSSDGNEDVRQAGFGPVPSSGSCKYRGMDAEETARAYFKEVSPVRAASVAVMAAMGIGAVLSALRHNMVAYLAFLLGVLLVGMWYKRWAVQRFFELGGVVYEDCDPARYRIVLERIAEKEPLRRSEKTIQTELAYCDLLELDPDRALGRLGRIGFRSRRAPGWFRIYQIEFMCHMDRGDLGSARMVLDKMTAMAGLFKDGTPNRGAIEQRVRDFTLMIKPAAARDAFDAAYMRDRAAMGETHQIRAEWQVILAEYELLHGSESEALRLATDPALDPMTPRIERMRSGLLARLGS